MVRYAVIFLMTNFVITIAIGVLLTVLQINKPAVMNLIVSSCAAYFAGVRFYKNKEREPTKPEVNGFTNLSMILLLISGCVIGYVSLRLNGQLESLLPAMFSWKTLVIFIALAVVYYVVIKYLFSKAIKDKLKNERG